MWHAFNEPIENLLSDVPPHLRQSCSQGLSNCIRTTLKVFCIRISPVELSFDMCPEVLDWIKIGRIWRPFHQSKFMSFHCVLEPFMGFIGCMRSSIVLLKDTICCTFRYESINVRKEMLFYSIRHMKKTTHMI